MTYCKLWGLLATKVARVLPGTPGLRGACAGPARTPPVVRKNGKPGGERRLGTRPGRLRDVPSPHTANLSGDNLAGLRGDSGRRTCFGAASTKRLPRAPGRARVPNPFRAAWETLAAAAWTRSPPERGQLAPVRPLPFHRRARSRRSGRPENAGRKARCRGSPGARTPWGWPRLFLGSRKSKMAGGQAPKG